MNKNSRIVKVALCCPSDVVRELEIAIDVVTEWNRKHSDSLNLYLRHQHWTTDSSPDLLERAQGVINRQVIDDADIVVAVFWSRFGTPTGEANSGTEEEIRRGIALGKRVMVYFSDLKVISKQMDRFQLTKLKEFRGRLEAKGLCWSFSRRQDFRRSFDRHLANAVNDIISHDASLSVGHHIQKIIGNNNIQVGGSINYYQKPAVIKPIIERRQGSVSASESKKIHDLIDSLVEGTVGKTRREAYSEWWVRFHNYFDVAKVEELSSEKMEDVRKWYKQQKGMQTQGLKTKAPDAWRTERIKAIKSAMRSMGHTNETYYPEVAKRLKLKKPFHSLKELTKRDLDRVYAMARRDSLGN